MIRFFSSGSSCFCPSIAPSLALAVMWYLVFISSLLSPMIRKSGSPHAVPMSAHSGILAAVNRPPGCGDAIGMTLSGLDRSPGGLSLMDATSKDADDAGAEDADWSCAEAVVAA